VHNPSAEERAKDLLAAWRAAQLPIVHVRHVCITACSPLSGSGIAFKSQVAPKPDEVIIEKSINAAFIGTNLHAQV